MSDPIFPINPESNNAEINASVTNSGIIQTDISGSSSIPMNVEDHEIDMEVLVRRTGTINIDFDGIGKCKVLYDTKENWNSDPKRIAKKGYIYIYSNYKTHKGKNIAGMKVGDGLSYLIDMAFLDDIYADHIKDQIIHVSQQDRDFWNNKVRCYMEDEVVGENLIFTTR